MLPSYYVHVMYMDIINTSYIYHFLDPNNFFIFRILNVLYDILCFCLKVTLYNIIVPFFLVLALDTQHFIGKISQLIIHFEDFYVGTVNTGLLELIFPLYRVIIFLWLLLVTISCQLIFHINVTYTSDSSHVCTHTHTHTHIRKQTDNGVTTERDKWLLSDNVSTLHMKIHFVTQSKHSLKNYKERWVNAVQKNNDCCVLYP